MCEQDEQSKNTITQQQQRRENTLSKVQINRLFARAIYMHKKKKNKKKTNEQTNKQVCATHV